jgi:TM2 domain-containing membrane protein YozV
MNAGERDRRIVTYLLGVITNIIVSGAHLTYLTQNHEFIIIQSTFSINMNIKRDVYMAVRINIRWVSTFRRNILPPFSERKTGRPISTCPL